MTLSVTVGGVEVATSGLLIVPESGLISITACADGSSGDSGLRIDDPSGSLSFQQWDQVIITESACSQPRCFTGYIYQFTISRGDYTGGAGRVWELSVIDMNALLSWRRFHTADAKRPAETGTQRLTWLMTTAGMSGLIFDNGKIMANAWLYDEADYRDQTAYEVLGSIIDAAAAGRWTFFVYWDPSATPGEEVSLFYGEVTTTTFDSTMSISNVASDVTGGGGLVVPPWQDADLTQVGADIWDGIDVTGPFGRLYRQLASTYTTFGVHRDAVYDTTRNNNLTSASLHATSFLAKHAVGIDTITCTVRLPRSQVNLIDAGMRLPSGRFSHLPGYDPGVPLRVARRSFTFAPRRNTYYDVKLTLSARGINQAGGGGSPGDFPLQPPPAPLHWWSGTGTIFGDDPAQIVSPTSAVFAGTGDIFTYHATITTQAYPGTYSPNVTLGGLAMINASAQGEGLTVDYDGTFNDLFVGTGTFNLYMAAADSDHSHTHTATITWWIDPVGWDPGDAPNPPAPGQWVGTSPAETVTMSGANGATVWPFADNSLVVLQDGFDQSLHIASYDGAAGTFTLDYTPDIGSTITVRYQGR